MQNIDFLPTHYRQQAAQRQSKPWRVAVIAVFVAVLAAASLSQTYGMRQVKAELSLLEPTYQTAQQQNQALQKVQAELKNTRDVAELYTYLQHPWPRTQLLAALLRPLPPQITLEQLQITRETLRNPNVKQPKTASALARRRESEKDLTQAPLAVQDLKSMRAQFDTMQTVIHLKGISTEASALHKYLGQLGKLDLMQKAELDSSQVLEGEQGGVIQFEATLFVRPGYGHAKGPRTPPHKNLAHTRSQDRRDD